MSYTSYISNFSHLKFSITTPSGSTLVVSLLNRILQELHDGGLGALGAMGFPMGFHHAKNLRFRW